MTRRADRDDGCALARPRGCVSEDELAAVKRAPRYARYRRRARVAAAILAGGLALAACGSQAGGSSGGGSASGGSAGGVPNPGDNGTDDSCFSKFEPPDTGINVGASVKGSVQLFCKLPPQSHHLDIRLQRDVNGAWTDQNRRQWDDIPPNVPMFRLVTAPCVPGSWRLVYSVWGVSASGKAFQHDGRTGITRKVNPSDCG